MRLYTYDMSSAAYRVRIALALKGICAEEVSVDLRSKEQFDDEFNMLNPMSRVPVLMDKGLVIRQSRAIITYLDEKIPEPRLLPDCADDALFATEIVDTIACDIHPLGNISVLRRLRTNFNVSDGELQSWRRYWIEFGFSAIERRLNEHNTTKIYALGEQPSIVECYLIPQVRNARQSGVIVDNYRRVYAIDRALRAIPAVASLSQDET